VFTDAKDRLIPDPAVYADWFAKADEKRRRLAVGARRYYEVEKKLGRRPEYADFVDPDAGDLLPIAALMAEAPAARHARLAKVKGEIERRREDKEEVATLGFLRPPARPPTPSPSGRFSAAAEEVYNFVAAALSRHKAGMEDLVEDVSLQLGLLGKRDLDAITDRLGIGRRRSKAEAIEAVKDLFSSEATGTPPEPPARTAEPGENLEQMIRAAALELNGGRAEVRIRIADLRKRLAHVPSDELTAALRSLSRRRELTMYPHDDPRQIKPEDEAAAVYTLTGVPQHIIYFGGAYS